MAKRWHLISLALLGACTSDPDLDTTHYELVETGLVRLRPIDITPDILDDWSTDKQISQNLVANATLKVRYCAEHFPEGSQVLANLKQALTAYSAAPGVSIDITDIAAEPGTEAHPDLSTFTYPSDAIYLDYKAMDAYAAASFMSCDRSSPKQCTQAKILISDSQPGFSNPMVVDDATSVGVFMHELGHVFGMVHINNESDSIVLLEPTAMALDRTTIHGLKTHATDFRSNLIHAATLGMLQTYYGDPTDPELAIDEIVAHHNMSTAFGDTHVEWNPSKTYTYGTATAAIEDLNETKLRWNAAHNSFEPCTNYGTLPRWFARMSETSTNTTNTPFEAVFEVTNNTAGTTWREVASSTHDSLGANDLRQIDWERTFHISLGDVGLASAPSGVVDRKLRFRADAGNDLAERNEANNQWWVNVCLYPASDTTCSRECLQPSSPSSGTAHGDD
ncbi:MAG: hypothetical protein ACKV2T_32475 [Kofleriaceae bacterium]